jgi:SAM-dependent methyltransferase
VRTSDRHDRLGDARYQLCACRDCELIFVVDPPSDLLPFYAAEYFHLPADDAEYRRRSEAERWKLDLVRRYVPGGRLLEFGPATGEFASLARKAGFEVALVEQDARCAAFLRERQDFQVTHGSDPLAALAEQVGEFDLICLWQVIEHLPSFWTFLERAAARLRAGGALVISTPNPDALQFDLLGRFWVHLDSPRHLYLIPPAWFRARARRLGLALSLLTTQDPGSLAWNGFGWEHSLRGVLPGVAGKALGRIGRLAGRLWAPLERREGRGSAYTVVLTREGT